MTQAESCAHLLRDAASDFLVDQAGTARLRGWIARPRPVERRLWRQTAELGWTGLLLRESLGGSGLPMADAVLLSEVAGRYLFAEPLVACAVMPALLLAAADAGENSELTARLAQTLVEGQRMLAVAWQEAPGELDAESPRCEVAGNRLTGRKCFVPGCESDAIVLVWARLGGEAAWVAVDAQGEGVRCIVEPAGLSSQTTLRFDQAPVLDTLALLRGDAARHALQRTLAGGRLALSGELVGLAAGALAQTLVHLRSRQQFDRTLGSFQTVQHRCVDLHIEIELARASLQQALALFDATSPAEISPATDAAICAAKARAGDAAVRVGREAVQLHGAMGFCDEVDIGLYLRAALHANAWLGGPVALRRRFATHSIDISHA